MVAEVNRRTFLRTIGGVAALIGGGVAIGAGGGLATARLFKTRDVQPCERPLTSRLPIFPESSIEYKNMGLSPTLGPRTIGAVAIVKYMGKEIGYTFERSEVICGGKLIVDKQNKVMGIRFEIRSFGVLVHSFRDGDLMSRDRDLMRGALGSGDELYQGNWYLPLYRDYPSTSLYEGGPYCKRWKESSGSVPEYAHLSPEDMLKDYCAERGERKNSSSFKGTLIGFIEMK
jgi:hypothetical protein